MRSQAAVSVLFKLHIMKKQLTAIINNTIKHLVSSSGSWHVAHPRKNHSNASNDSSTHLTIIPYVQSICNTCTWIDCMTHQPALKIYIKNKTRNSSSSSHNCICKQFLAFLMFLKITQYCFFNKLEGKIHHPPKMVKTYFSSQKNILIQR